MKLHKLHVHQLSASFIRERHSIAGIFPGIRGDLIRFADPARCQHNRLRPEHHEAPVFAPVAECAYYTPAVRQQSRDRALHVHVETHLHAAILQCADHLQSGAVAYVAQPPETVSPECALQDSPVLGTIK